VSTPVLKI
jgi:hypothetical protein